MLRQDLDRERVEIVSTPASPSAPPGDGSLRGVLFAVAEGIASPWQPSQAALTEVKLGQSIARIGAPPSAIHPGRRRPDLVSLRPLVFGVKLLIVLDDRFRAALRGVRVEPGLVEGSPLDAKVSSVSVLATATPTSETPTKPAIRARS